MEDIVAVAIELNNGEERFFMAWGRIQDTVDPKPLEQLILKHCVGYSLGGKPVKASMCWTLQEANQAPHFYEGLFSFSQRPIPFGDHYQIWRAEMNEKMQTGKGIYYLGNPYDFIKKKE